MLSNFFNNLIINYAFIINMILFYKYNSKIIRELISFDFIVKLKIQGAGYQKIMGSEISTLDNQSYPDEIFIENENKTIKNISREYIYLNDVNNSVIMKWNKYSNSTRRMFDSCVNITEIDLTDFDLTLITNKVHIFLNCKGLANVKFGNYETYSLTSTYGMFYNCIKLVSIDLSKFITSNVSDMILMFFNWRSLNSLNLSSVYEGIERPLFGQKKGGLSISLFVIFYGVFM